MTNEELIERVASKIQQGGCVNPSHYAKKVIELVRDSEWISVDDELPDNMDMGLTVYYKNDVAETDTNCDVYLDHLGFCVFRGKEANPIVGVTHWKRRPEPPKQDKQI